ncbi:MAG: hypothetical protein LUF86_06570, partial [Clostridiales bacterium]|nr:hypothetical protein [Clostridiales bacterium]
IALDKVDSYPRTGIWSRYKYWACSSSYSKQTKLHYVYLDGEGNTVGDIHTVDGQLSDCQPIVSNSSVVWYVTGDANGTSTSTATTPYFYSIDANGTFHVQAELSAPSVSVSAVTGGFQVSWNAVDGAEGYYVYCASGSSRSSQTVEGGDATSATFTISGTSSKTYTVWVEAYAGSSKSLAQNKVEFLYIPSPTVTLTNTASGVQVSWSA